MSKPIRLKRKLKDLFRSLSFLGLTFSGLTAVSLFSFVSHSAPVDPTSTVIYLEPGRLLNLYSRVTWHTGETVLAPVTSVPSDAVLSLDLRQFAIDVDSKNNASGGSQLIVHSTDHREVPSLARDQWVCGISVIDNPDIDAEEGDADSFQLRNDLCLPIATLSKLKALEGNFAYLSMVFEEYKHGNEQPLLHLLSIAKDRPLPSYDNGQLTHAARNRKERTDGKGDSRVTQMISPIKGCGQGCLVVTSEFNPKRKHPKLKVRRPHRGIDLRAKKGSPIVATLDGVVLTTKYQRRGAGKYIILNHSGNKSTRYLHLSAFKTRPGKNVSQGDVIGLSGMTGGISTGPHLHYEVRVDGVAFNPRVYLKNFLLGNLPWPLSEIAPDGSRDEKREKRNSRDRNKRDKDRDRDHQYEIEQKDLYQEAPRDDRPDHNENFHPKKKDDRGNSGERDAQPGHDEPQGELEELEEHDLLDEDLKDYDAPLL